MRQTKYHILAILILFSSCCPIFLRAGSPSTKPPKSERGIFQLIESRDGRTSCWGVVICLGELSFKDTVDQDYLTITEAKHASDLKELMSWKVDQSHKRLTVSFKRGMGDFGSGNDVTVRIRGDAIVGEPEQDYVFTIATDVL